MTILTRVPRRHVAALLVATAFIGGCATTVDETPSADDESSQAEENPALDATEAELTGGEGRDLAEDDVTLLDSEVVVDSNVPVTTVPIAGTASELLPEIGIEMSRLSGEIAGDGDEDATLIRIEASWNAIVDEVRVERPELVDSIQSTIDMARTAVTANRPADADKAFGILTDLIDAYTGDS